MKRYEFIVKQYLQWGIICKERKVKQVWGSVELDCQLIKLIKLINYFPIGSSIVAR